MEEWKPIDSLASRRSKDSLASRHFPLLHLERETPAWRVRRVCEPVVHPYRMSNQFIHPYDTRSPGLAVCLLLDRGGVSGGPRAAVKGKTDAGGGRAGQNTATSGADGVISRALKGLPDRAARPVAERMATGTPRQAGCGLVDGQRPRCVKIFSITSGCSMNARRTPATMPIRMIGSVSCCPISWYVG